MKGFKETISFALLVAVIVLIPILSRSVPALANYQVVMTFAGIFSLVTMGLSLLMGFAGQVSLGHAAFMGLGAYISGILTAKYGISPILSILAGMILTGAVAYLVGRPTLKLKGHYLAMATLGIGVIANITFNEEVALTGGPSGLTNIPKLTFLGFSFHTDFRFYVLTWAVVLMALLFSRNMLKSRVGRGLMAIHFTEKGAEAAGVDTSSYKLKVFVLSGIYASLAGSLYAHYVNFITPGSFSLFWSIKFVMMAVIGGMSSLWGALLGTGLITFLGNEWLHAFKDFEVLAYGLILLIICMFLPEGLAGGLAKLWDRFFSPKGL